MGKIDLFKVIAKAIRPASQEKQIFDWLNNGFTLTSLQALSLFGCLRLSGRIFDLREKGHDIKATLIKTKTGKWVAEYTLKNK